MDRFAFDKAALQPKHRKTIRELALELVRTSRRYTNRLRVQIDLEGHTDPVGSPDYNYTLGMRRALAVRDEFQRLLRRQLGNRLTITSSSEGETQPVASNASPSGRTLNRRVNVRVDVTLLRTATPTPKPKPRKVPPKRGRGPVDAFDACLSKMSYFKSLYDELTPAARKATLTVENGKLRVSGPTDSYGKLFSEELQEKVREKLVDPFKKPGEKILRKSIPLMKYIDALKILIDVGNRVDNERLVSRDGEKWKRKRFEKKLSILMDILARDPAFRRKRPQFRTPGDAKVWLWKNYRRYEKLLDECYKLGMDPTEEARIGLPK